MEFELKTHVKGKIGITFVMFTDLRTGAGTENNVLNLIKHKPEDGFEIKIMQTDFLDKQRISDLELQEYVKDVKVLSIRGYEQKFKFLSESNTGLFLSRFIISPFVNLFMKISKNRNILKEVSDSDVIYLYYNEYYRLFGSSSAKLVGTNHTSLAGKDSLYSRLLFLLIRAGLIYRRIDGFHIFPSNSKFLHNLKAKENVVAPLGIDSDIFFPIPVRESHPLRLLFVGRLERCKGTEVVYEAWKKLSNDPGIELHIVGTGPREQIFADLVGGNVVFHGAIPVDRLTNIYRESDVFIYPTSCDTFGQVVIEAISSGLYVITSEYLRGTFDKAEELGFLEYISPTPDALVRAVLAFKEKGRSYIEGQQRRIDQHKFIKAEYDWEIVSKKLYSYFAEICN